MFIQAGPHRIRTVSFGDGGIPLAAGQALAAAISGAELVVVPGAGHVPTLCHPEAVVAAMEKFMQGLSPSPIESG